MGVAKALVAYVKSNSLLISKLGGDAKKFRPFQHLARDDFPYAEWIVLDEDVERVSEGMTDAVGSLVQIDCYSDDYAECVDLRDALFQELCHPTGISGRPAFRGSIGGSYIVSCWRSGVAEGNDIPQAGQTIAPYRLSQDFEIGYYLDTTTIT